MISRLEKADLLALLCVMFPCVFVTFPYDASGQVWYLIVSIPDLCIFLYFCYAVLSVPFSLVSGLTLGSLVCDVFLSLSYSMVFRVTCGTCLYRFMLYAFFLT